jgi:predicted MFS family arabinose efflux permease
MTENIKISRLFLPSVVLSQFAIALPSLLLSLLLIDMASTFSTSVGSMSQLNTVSSTVAIVSAFLMTTLSVIFRHKSLLLIGLLVLIISVLGCILAPNYTSILVAYSLTGITLAMTATMGVTLIREHLPLEKRAKAIGWFSVGGSSSYLIGAPVIAFIAGIKDWRLAFPAFILPISIISFYLAFVSIPGKSQNEQSNPSKEQHSLSKKSYFYGLKAVFHNKSATFCLLGSILRTAYFIAILLYAPSFYREKFLLSTNYASIILLIGATLYALGSLSAAWFVNRFGRKISTVVALFISGIFIIIYPYFSNLWLSLFFMFLACWFSGMTITAAVSLTLEQVPEYTGTMMSLNSVAVNIGNAVGSGIGGVVLISFGYKGLGNILGALGVLGAFIYYFLTKDILPTSEPI